ncbi:hypothetical protein FSP39_020856 [Pinctada imbricata]|uniref:Uncharacterized protein n=1 Tax=Pinctada imbricata TaxID=66713 RepID=A0AA88Y5N1_PINIB|nr:hypothetical protein FSP39_020856 [Pinctada imbricata]
MSLLQREHSMEVDPPASSSSSVPSTSSGTLKRSNSAPMINALVSQAQPDISPPANSFKFTEGTSSRIRRFSSSSMCLNATASATTPVKIPDRVNRLKEEESHIVEKEREHERETRSAIRMSNSWEEFHLEEHHEPMVSDHSQRRPRSFSESLHINVFPSPAVLLVGAPSPTRVGHKRQCFSPSMQIPVKSNSFTPSPSPSPTRKSFMRSLSPIAVRPSPVGKRKLENDTAESYLSPPKKFNHGPCTPDRIIAHPLAHSISSSSLDEGSPEQMVPRSSNMTDIRVQHQPNPNVYGFMPLRDSHDMQTTDSLSEHSDMTESTDISDPSISESPGSGFQPIRQSHL